jgi:GAF domain-containing protein
VLLPDDDCFVMVWSAGHSLPGQQKYRVPIKDTLSRLAYEGGEVYSWDDAQDDDRFQPNPKATWPTRAMISIPLRRGDRVAGVFNAIAAEPGAFDPAEERYLESLGSIISVAVGVWLDQAKRPKDQT